MGLRVFQKLKWNVCTEKSGKNGPPFYTESTRRYKHSLQHALVETGCIAKYPKRLAVQRIYVVCRKERAQKEYYRLNVFSYLPSNFREN